MTGRPGWYLDPTGRHRLRYRDDSGWTAWVADDAGAVVDPTRMPAELLPAEGWYPDPGAFRQRWWDGRQWTNRVVGSGLRIRYSRAQPGWAPPPEIHGAGAQRERNGRNAAWLLLALLGSCAFIALFVLGLYSWSQSSQENYRDIQRSFEEWRREGKVREKLMDELDTWRVPETVILGSRSDDQDLGMTVTRHFVPTGGVDVQRAAEDLVASLRTQGYEDLAATGDGEWQGECEATPSCRLQIKVNAAGDRISVTLVAA